MPVTVLFNRMIAAGKAPDPSKPLTQSENPYNARFFRITQHVRGHKTGGKQYRVAAGEKLKVEQIPADVGAEITLDQILMVGEGESVKIGAPSFPEPR